MFKKKKKEKPQILVKDMLVDLEKDNRTKEQVMEISNREFNKIKNRQPGILKNPTISTSTMGTGTGSAFSPVLRTAAINW